MDAKLITFEGIDGVGKTTHVAYLMDFLADRKIDAAAYREPGATLLGEELRGILKQGMVNSQLAELLLFCAARAELIEQRVKPTLESGTFVVLDRFTDSTLAYQGALRNIDSEHLKVICTAASHGLIPDLTLWLDLEPVEAFRRRYPLAQAFGDSPNMLESAELDAIEQRSIGYFTRVRQRYAALAAAEPERYVRVDASGSLEETADAVRSTVKNRLQQWQN